MGIFLYYFVYFYLDQIVYFYFSIIITLYHHDKSRSGEVVKEVLGDYSGYIHCDMWGAYRQAKMPN